MSAKKVTSGSLMAVLILIIAQILAHMIDEGLTLLNVPESICNIILGVLYFVFAYFLLKLLARILKLDLKELGIPKFRIELKWIVIGIALPLLVMTIFLLLPGKFISVKMDSKELFSILSYSIFFSGLAAAFVEEMIFRGIVLNLLKQKWNSVIAIIVPSTVFAALHLIGMDFSLLNYFHVLFAGTLAGIMFSLIALKGNSVWNSGIVHAFWNILTSSILVIGTEPDDTSKWTYVLESKHFIITGGDFGIETSIISICSYILVIFLVIFMIKRRKFKESKNLKV